MNSNEILVYIERKIRGIFSRTKRVKLKSATIRAQNGKYFRDLCNTFLNLRF